ncbi:hypothetical protein MMC07_007376 [Pseudocyphellaria aurata]|nr:hypothetical protein [Pseudocyphellaria aurata]
MPAFLPLLLFSLNHLIHSAKATTSGCGLQIPTEVTAGGASYNFTDFLSNSTSPSCYLDTSPSCYRAYRLTIPEDYDINTPAPLILAFHGRTETNLDQLQRSKLSNSFFNTKAIVAYPQGIDRQWLGDPDAPSTINDTVFASELLTYLESRFCVDPLQVFATGKSNGGGFTGRLACDSEMSSRIAAFAPVSGAFYRDFMGPCYPSRSSIPILEFHGGADKTILYEGGEDASQRGVTVSIPSWLQDWAVRDGCTDPFSNTTVVLPEDGGMSVQRTTWDCNGQDGIVSHYFSENLTHVWPNETNAGYNATSVILDYFYAHPLPAAE